VSCWDVCRKRANYMRAPRRVKTTRFREKNIAGIGQSDDLYLAEDVFDFGAEAPGSSLVEPFFDVGELFE
jgi:hypothetical protein